MKTYKQCCSEVAIKHKLGKSLVTGHRAGYWEEAAEMYASQFKQKTINKSAEEIQSEIEKQIKKT